MKGSESGAVVTPGKTRDSLILKVTSVGRMPPSGKKLTEAELSTLRAWIDGGALLELEAGFALAFHRRDLVL